MVVRENMPKQVAKADERERIIEQHRGFITRVVETSWCIQRARKIKISLVSGYRKCGPRQGRNFVDCVLPLSAAGGVIPGLKSLEVGVAGVKYVVTSVSSTLLFGSMTAMLTTMAATSYFHLLRCVRRWCPWVSDRLRYLADGIKSKTWDPTIS